MQLYNFTFKDAAWKILANVTQKQPDILLTHLQSHQKEVLIDNKFLAIH